MGELFKHNAADTGSKERTTTTVVVSELDIDGEETELPLANLIEDLQEALSKVPEQFRNTAVLKINGYGDYVNIDAGIRYTRPETDDELADRQRWLRETREATEAREKREFERL